MAPSAALDQPLSESVSNGLDDGSSIAIAESGMTTPADEYRFSFHQNGKVDEVEIFGFGEHAKLSGLVGLRRLHRIVFAGSTGVRMDELVGQVSNSNAEIGASGGAVNDQLADTEGIRKIKEELSQLQQNASDALSDQHKEKAAECRHQMRDLAGELLKLQTPSGRPRLVNEVNKWRSIIYSNLKTVYKQLRNRGHKQLAAHFQSSISSTGSTEAVAVFRYVPTSLIAWEDRQPR